MIKHAFVDAIRRFVALPAVGDGEGLRYKWPKYLSRQHGASHFWNDLYQGMMNALSRTPLLESRYGGPPQEPTNLRYVPRAYRFEGRTLFDLPLINQTHLSFAYDDVQRDLSLIGVVDLDIKRLCEEFLFWIDNVGIAGVRAQPTEWHQKFSSVFCGSPVMIREKLRESPIVPLRDGSWVKATTDGVYFAPMDEAEYVPTGVDLSIVDRHVSENPERRNFLEFLGIREYRPGQVCELILKLHDDMACHSSSRTIKDLVADAMYFFKHRSELQHHGPPRIYFTAMRGGEAVAVLSSEIYLIDPAVKPGLVAQYRSTAGSPFAVLSEEYETEVCEQGPRETVGMFRQWLLKSKHATFSTVPTLLRNNGLSDEWVFLREHSVIDLLQAIKLYSEKMGALSLRIIQAATELQVPCLDGTSKALSLLAVPTTELEQSCPYIDFARLPEPTIENWGFLSDFGVVTTCNTTARLRELQKLGQLQPAEVDRNAVYEIYQALNSSPTCYWEEIQ